MLARRDVDALLDYRERAPGVRQALPTHEHFVPVVVALGAAIDDSQRHRPLPDHRLRVRHRHAPLGSVRVTRRAWRTDGGVRSGTGDIRTAALLLAVATGACAGHLPPCPAAGGPAWTELQGAHFRLRTDGTRPPARAALDDLEQFQAALLTVFGAPAGSRHGPPVPSSSSTAGGPTSPPAEVSGYFTRALFQPLIVMRAGGDLVPADVIKHELVHYFSGMVMPEQPPWLSEGLATYYETIEYDRARAAHHRRDVRRSIGSASPNASARPALATVFAAKAI